MARNAEKANSLLNKWVTMKKVSAIYAQCGLKLNICAQNLTIKHYAQLHPEHEHSNRELYHNGTEKPYEYA
jgi:hypothetical protein